MTYKFDKNNGNLDTFLNEHVQLNYKQIRAVYLELGELITKFEAIDSSIAEYFRCQQEMVMNHIINDRFDGDIELALSLVRN